MTPHSTSPHLALQPLGSRRLTQPSPASLHPRPPHSTLARLARSTLASRLARTAHLARRTPLSTWPSRCVPSARCSLVLHPGTPRPRCTLARCAPPSLARVLHAFLARIASPVPRSLALAASHLTIHRCVCVI
ncbi:hypothetical protein B0H12DRAFT_1151782 [Mycena haematopus]|nr:hypothetical protein B0H12DRAFT_1151782 [Mycena haematopus]